MDDELRSLLKRDEGDPRLTRAECARVAELSRRLWPPERANMTRINLGKAGRI